MNTYITIEMGMRIDRNRTHEVRQFTNGEHEVTAASVLAEEMLAILDALGETESASKSH